MAGKTVSEGSNRPQYDNSSAPETRSSSRVEAPQARMLDRKESTPCKERGAEQKLSMDTSSAAQHWGWMHVSASLSSNWRDEDGSGP